MVSSALAGDVMLRCPCLRMHCSYMGCRQTGCWARRVKPGTHAGLQEREIFFRAMYSQIQAVSDLAQLHVCQLCDLTPHIGAILMACLLKGVVLTAQSVRQGGVIKGAAFWQYIQADQARLFLLHAQHVHPPLHDAVVIGWPHSDVITSAVG